MHSPSDAVVPHEDGGNDELQLSRDVDQLLMEYGEDADNVAASRADALFREGDMTSGARWLRIFRKIAMARRSRRY